MIFTEKSQIKKNVIFYLNLFLSCYYCSIDLKSKSEHLGLRPGTSSLVSGVNWIPKAMRLATLYRLKIDQRKFCPFFDFTGNDFALID